MHHAPSLPLRVSTTRAHACRMWHVCVCVCVCVCVWYAVMWYVHGVVWCAM
jgi:hypothetical protein